MKGLVQYQQLGGTTERSQLVELVHDDAWSKLQCARPDSEMQMVLRHWVLACLGTPKDLWRRPCHRAEDVTDRNLSVFQ